MSDFALDWALMQPVRGDAARAVLTVLASVHHQGGFCVPTQLVCDKARLDRFATVASLWELRNAGLIRAEGIGGLMSVELGCDFQLEGAE
ncbi:hypothetical protein FIV00_15010 [Labrenzia sp. THAF82]|uniref:hypothetical protein n=1 Tax=Labrenzia sp. THAF82 TaxID=2587861 RepID=UPI001268EDE6|nr:hypothetical protein [Labrenzia sp. THAF82]QFT31800.1 hypothetical protein FIV00_15010 [Labrenzia sp. THAF82]